MRARKLFSAFRVPAKHEFQRRWLLFFWTINLRNFINIRRRKLLRIAHNRISRRRSFHFVEEFLHLSHSSILNISPNKIKQFLYILPEVSQDQDQENQQDTHIVQDSVPLLPKYLVPGEESLILVQTYVFGKMKVPLLKRFFLFVKSFFPFPHQKNENAMKENEVPKIEKLRRRKKSSPKERFAFSKKYGKWKQKEAKKNVFSSEYRNRSQKVLFASMFLLTYFPELSGSQRWMFDFISSLLIFSVLRSVFPIVFFYWRFLRYRKSFAKVFIFGTGKFFRKLALSSSLENAETCQNTKMSCLFHIDLQRVEEIHGSAFFDPEKYRILRFLLGKHETKQKSDRSLPWRNRTHFLEKIFLLSETDAVSEGFPLAEHVARQQLILQKKIVWNLFNSSIVS